MKDHVSPTRSGPSRRQLLSVGLAAAAATAGTAVAPEHTWAASTPGPSAPVPSPPVPSAAGPSAAGPSRAPSPLRWTARKSQNGWPLVNSHAVRRRRVEGSDARTSLLPGAASVVLLHVARRYHYEVEPLGPDDVLGHRSDRSLRAPYESNLLSGTAIWLNPGLHPAGATGTLFPLQVTVLRDILADCEGVVRWGGDDAALPAEGFFQVDLAPGDAKLARVAARMSDWRLLPGRGAGSPVDPFDAARRSRAQHLQKLQAARARS
jgi:hypothetical protein